MRRIEKPWGFELVWAETDRYVGKLLHIRAGTRLSLQYHRRKDETMLLQTGEVDLLLEGADGVRVTRRLQEGVSVHIAPGRVTGASNARRGGGGASYSRGSGSTGQDPLIGLQTF